MKQIAFCLILVLLFILPSCSKAEVGGNDKFNTEIVNRSVSVNCLSTDFSAVVNNRNSVTGILITSPEELKGLLITASIDTTTVKFGNLKLDYSQADSVKSCPYLAFAKALRIADDSKPVKIIKDKSSNIYEYLQEDEKYRITVNKSTGNITEIEACSYRFAVV